MLRQSRGTQWPGLSIERGGLLEEVGAVEQTGGLMDIDLSSLLLVPLSWQDGSGPPPEGSPFFRWVSSTQKKGIQGSSMGLLTAWGPALRAEQGHPGTVPCFHFRCCQPAAQKDLS